MNADPTQHALALSARYDDEVRALVPPGAEIFDAHLHLGNDIDGMVGDYDQLEDVMAAYGVSRAFMFCLDEPDRHPGFTVANDRTLAFGARSAGRLIPFVRLDLNEGPIEEAQRCLDLGAGGIKLHPRAQGFGSGDARLEPVFALAEECDVPILIHGGRGLPPIAEGLARLVDRHPGATLIIAHAGIADMAALGDALAGRPQVFFDTSTWSPIDLLDFLARVPPEQVVYASDFPYGQQPASLFYALRTAARAGYDEEQIRAMLGGNAARIADRAAPVTPRKAVGALAFEQPLYLARIHSYIGMAQPLLWLGHQDMMGVLGLAVNACNEGSDTDGVAERIRELLEAVGALWEMIPGGVDYGNPSSRLAAKLLMIADVEAVTAHP